MHITLSDELAAKLEALARHQNRTPEEILSHLIEQMPDAPNPPRQRVPGLGRGTMHMSDDFDDPLGDDFWLDES